MRSLNIPQPLSGGIPTKALAAVKAMTSAYALSAAELIARAGGAACVPLDEWGSKLA